MNRFKCPACGGNQYTACSTAEGCIYCGHKELKKMETLARRNTMRLIDEAALIEEAETGNWDTDIKELKMILKYVPTIDAVPVVRCKECEYYNTTGCSKGFGWCESMDRGVSDDFYCANGKQLNKESEVK
jgi:hypothetical protein